MKSPTSPSPDAPQSAIKTPSLVLLALIAAINPMAMGMFVPSMPSIAAEFGTSYSQVQLGLSLFFASTAIAQLIIGPLSDQYGRRPVLLWSMTIFIIGTLATYLAASLLPLLMGRALQAAGAAGIVISRAIVRDTSPPHKAASLIGYVTMGMAIAPMLGPALGGLLDEHFGWRASFMLLGVFGVAVSGLIYFSLEETNTNRGMPFSRQFTQYGKLLRDGAFWSYVAVAAFTSCIFFAFLGGAPALADKVLGLSPSVYGAYFGITALGYAIGNFISGRKSEQLGLAFMLGIGGLIALLGAATPFIFFQLGLFSTATLFGPAIFIGIGNGMVLPSAVAGCVLAQPNSAGAASGLLGALQIGSGAIASSLAGHAVGANGTQVEPFLLVVTIIAAISIICIYHAIRRGSPSNA